MEDLGALSSAIQSVSQLLGSKLKSVLEDLALHGRIVGLKLQKEEDFEKSDHFSCALVETQELQERVFQAQRRFFTKPGSKSSAGTRAGFDHKFLRGPAQGQGRPKKQAPETAGQQLIHNQTGFAAGFSAGRDGSLAKARIFGAFQMCHQGQHN